MFPKPLPEGPHFSGPIALAALPIEGQTDNERDDFSFADNGSQLRPKIYGRSADDGRARYRDGKGRITPRDTYSFAAVIDGEIAAHAWSSKIQRFQAATAPSARNFLSPPALPKTAALTAKNVEEGLPPGPAKGIKIGSSPKDQRNAKGGEYQQGEHCHE
jgi:hypothetical protein